MGPPDPGPHELARAAAAFRALAHVTRLHILVALRSQEQLSPTQLTAELGDGIALANVAHHTRVLARLGLLAPAGTRPVRGAIEHFYRITPQGMSLLELVGRVPGQEAADDAVRSS